MWLNCEVTKKVATPHPHTAISGISPLSNKTFGTTQVTQFLESPKGDGGGEGRMGGGGVELCMHAHTNTPQSVHKNHKTDTHI